MRLKMFGSEVLPPIILTAILWPFILNLFRSRVEIEPVAPIVVVEEPVETPASSPAPYLNTLTLLSTIAIAGFTLFIIFKKFPKMISLISIGSFWIVTFLTLLVHLGYIGQLSIILPEGAVLVISLLTSTFLALLVRKVSGPAALTAASITAAAGGTLIGYMIPFFTFVVLLISLSVFDLVMVKKGYLSLLSQEQYRGRIHQLRGLVVEVGDINLGLGDLLFYTITVTAAFFRLGLVSAIASNLAIMAGYYLTLQLLKKWDTVPGLTIPLVLALVSAFAVQHIHF